MTSADSSGAAGAPDDTPPPPLLRVVRGDPSPAELAAVVTVLAGVGGSGAEPTPASRGRWNDPAALVRRTLHPGPGAWRASAGPR